MLRVKNWGQVQHYKDRNPPWIKLHFSLLSSKDWVTLDDASRVLAIACMLIASKSDGQIDDSEAGAAYMRRVAYLNKSPNFKPLIECGFLECDNKCKQMLADARPETEVPTETQVPTKTESMLGKPDALNGSKAAAIEILDYLNRNAERTYRPVDTNLKLIVARLKSGATPLQCREVIFAKCQQWKGDSKMSEYLRPATLFNQTKFEQYLGEIGGMPSV